MSNPYARKEGATDSHQASAPRRSSAPPTRGPQLPLPPSAVPCRPNEGRALPPGGGRVGHAPSAAAAEVTAASNPYGRPDGSAVATRGWSPAIGGVGGVRGGGTRSVRPGVPAIGRSGVAVGAGVGVAGPAIRIGGGPSPVPSHQPPPGHATGGANAGGARGGGVGVGTHGGAIRYVRAGPGPLVPVCITAGPAVPGAGNGGGELRIVQAGAAASTGTSVAAANGAGTGVVFRRADGGPSMPVHSPSLLNLRLSAGVGASAKSRAFAPPAQLAAHCADNRRAAAASTNLYGAPKFLFPRRRGDAASSSAGGCMAGETRPPGHLSPRQAFSPRPALALPTPTPLATVVNAMTACTGAAFTGVDSNRNLPHPVVPSSFPQSDGAPARSASAPAPVLGSRAISRPEGRSAPTAAAFVQKSRHTEGDAAVKTATTICRSSSSRQKQPRRNPYAATEADGVVVASGGGGDGDTVRSSREPRLCNPYAAGTGCGGIGGETGPPRPKEGMVSLAGAVAAAGTAAGVPPERGGAATSARDGVGTGVGNSDPTKADSGHTVTAAAAAAAPPPDRQITGLLSAPRWACAQAPHRSGATSANFPARGGAAALAEQNPPNGGHLHAAAKETPSSTQAAPRRQHNPYGRAPNKPSNPYGVRSRCDFNREGGGRGKAHGRFESESGRGAAGGAPPPPSRTTTATTAVVAAVMAKATPPSPAKAGGDNGGALSIVSSSASSSSMPSTSGMAVRQSRTSDVYDAGIDWDAECLVSLTGGDGGSLSRLSRSGASHQYRGEKTSGSSSKVGLGGGAAASVDLPPAGSAPPQGRNGREEQMTTRGPERDGRVAGDGSRHINGNATTSATAGAASAKMAGNDRKGAETSLTTGGFGIDSREQPVRGKPPEKTTASPSVNPYRKRPRADSGGNVSAHNAARAGTFLPPAALPHHSPLSGPAAVGSAKPVAPRGRGLAPGSKNDAHRVRQEESSIPPGARAAAGRGNLVRVSTGGHDQRKPPAADAPESCADHKRNRISDIYDAGIDWDAACLCIEGRPSPASKVKKPEASAAALAPASASSARETSLGAVGPTGHGRNSHLQSEVDLPRDVSKTLSNASSGAAGAVGNQRDNCIHVSAGVVPVGSTTTNAACDDAATVRGSRSRVCDAEGTSCHHEANNSNWSAAMARSKSANGTVAGVLGDGYCGEDEKHAPSTGDTAFVRSDREAATLNRQSNTNDSASCVSGTVAPEASAAEKKKHAESETTAKTRPTSATNEDAKASTISRKEGKSENIVSAENNENSPAVMETSVEAANTQTKSSSDMEKESSLRRKQEQAKLERPIHWTSDSTSVSNVTADAIDLTKSERGTSSTSSKPIIGSPSSSSSLPSLPPELCYTARRVAAVTDKYSKKLDENAELSAPLKNGWKLHPHQEEGVRKGLAMRRMVLAFDMGLGKTITACVWARAYKRTFSKLKVYVIAPASMQAEWTRTAQDIVGLEVEAGTTKKKKKRKRKKAKECEEDTEVEATEDPLAMHVCTWAKVPKGVPDCVAHFVVIGDEAHMMQNIASARTKATLTLLKHKRCAGAMLLTGTPMKNGKPLNLFPLLKAVRHPFGDKQKAYETHFCNGHNKQIGAAMAVIWDANGSSNLDQLNAHISCHVLHKTKEECLDDLPPKTREYRKVPVSSRDEIRHTNAVNKLAKIQSSFRDNAENKKEAMLTGLNEIRLISAFAKVDATVSLAKSVLEKEPAIVIFTFFVPVAKEVHRRLQESDWEGEILTGETPPKKRQGLVDNFQAGISAFIVCTFGAGGVGLTLTAASTIVLLDRPWTAGDAMQAEDRVRRIGQKRPVTSIWMRAFDIDNQMDSVIEKKNLTSSAVVERRGGAASRGDNANGKAAPKISIMSLAKAILSSPKGKTERSSCS